MAQKLLNTKIKLILKIIKTKYYELNFNKQINI